MRQQVKEACEEKKSEVTPYPVFLQQLSDDGKLDMTHDNRAMTKEYLKTYARGEAVPPMAYFIKVNEKGCSCFASPDAVPAGEGATCGDEDPTCGDEDATCGDAEVMVCSADKGVGPVSGGASTKQDPSKGVAVVATMEEFDALTSMGPVIIDFTATWCGPCKMIGPTFEKLSKEDANVGIKFIKVDVDDAEDVAEKCGVTAMPTFQVWRGGNKVSSLVGASKDKLAALIAKFA